MVVLAAALPSAELPDEELSLAEAELDAVAEEFSRSVACCLMELASAETLSISPPQGKFLPQASET